MNLLFLIPETPGGFGLYALGIFIIYSAISHYKDRKKN